MPVIQGICRAPSNVSGTDGNQYDLMVGKLGALMVAEMHGKYMYQNYRGNVASASLSSASAMVAPATNATPNFAIWNPAGNNAAVSLIKVNFGYVSGTPAAATIGYAYVPYAGATTGGTSAISAFTTLTVKTGIVGKSYGGNVLAGSAATVTGTGISPGTLLRYSALSTGAIPSASVAEGMNMVDDIDGGMIIPPGVMWYPVTSAASVATYMISAIWEEIPWP